MKKLTQKQIAMVAEKSKEYTDLMVYCNEPSEQGTMIAVNQILMNLIIDGYDNNLYVFNEIFQSIEDMFKEKIDVLRERRNEVNVEKLMA